MRVAVLPRFCILCCASCAGLLVFAGCAKKDAAQATTRPANTRERQDQALKDPFGYSPDVDRTDISGGGLSGFDRDGFGKDIKNVFNP
jgi:type IV pilus biogenesis protein CpaD/CtpE